MKGQLLQPVFSEEIEDASNQIKGGTVGLSTFKTVAAFDNIALTTDPLSD